ncbi:MAG TPA: type II toxin-antitoxin system RelE/ParE family toxin [Acidimicrobiales bacterium]|nr:type II toxin-antitoxin system RelE/ParE family toxin [Acidimicrobiales bacterium]
MNTDAWKLVVAAAAERSLDRLPPKIAVATVEFMVGPLIESPRQVGHPLRRELAGLWSARRGAYRIVYELDETERVVEVVRIDHPADVYRAR